MGQVSGAGGGGRVIATDEPMSSFWESDASPDWSVDFGPGEYERLAAWYARGHGFGDLRFDPFVPFMHKLRPDALKRYRLYNDSAGRGYGLKEHTRAIIPLALHYYVVERYPLGIHYALNGLRRMGISKAEVSDIFALAWFHTGPPVINTLADGFDEYMDQWAPDWDPGDRSPGFAWDDSWDVDPEAFACGIDFSVPHGNQLLPGELEAIEDWHRRVEGDVPAYVRYLARYYPLQLLTYRARYEQTVRGHLPKQYIALARLQLAALWHQPRAAWRALHMARYFGVPRDQVIHAFVHAMLYSSDIGIDSTLEIVDDILDAWPAGAGT
jgi:hypothetical protein